MLMLHAQVATMYTINNVFKWSFIFTTTAVLVLSESVVVTWLLVEIQALLTGISI